MDRRPSGPPFSFWTDKDARLGTTGQDAGRSDGASDGAADHPVCLASARRLFVRAARALDREIESLAADAPAEPDRERIKRIEGVTREAQRALLVLLEFEAKMDRRDPGEVDGALDLEAAREEIAGRLARLAERG